MDKTLCDILDDLYQLVATVAALKQQRTELQKRVAQLQKENADMTKELYPAGVDGTPGQDELNQEMEQARDELSAPQ